MVFDRAAVIAPQRPRRVGCIKKRALLKGIYSQRGRKAAWKEGDLESEAGKDIYSFCVNNFHICGEITSDVLLGVLWGIKISCPP